MQESKWSDQENRFLSANQDFQYFCGQMEFGIFDADIRCPQEMFVRVGLSLIGHDQQVVGAYIEGDRRVFARFFGLPADTPRDILSRLCREMSITERKKMLREIPELAERHEKAWADRESARALISAAEADIIL